MALVNSSVQEFSRIMGSISSTPGGGSACALAGAMAASLLTKVCRLTMGREKYQAAETLARSVLIQSETARQALLDLVDQDAMAYELIKTARALPNSSEAQQKRRETAVQQALLRATETPMGIARHSAKVHEMAQSLVGRVNVTTASDVGVAGLLAIAAIEGAAMTVDMNLPHLHDTVYVQQTRQSLETLWRQAQRRSRSLDLQMKEWLSGLSSS